MDRHEQLIDKLSRDLTPVAPVRNVNLTGLAWLVASAVFVMAVTQAVDPVRPGVFGQFAENPRFLLETLLGVAAIAWIGLVAFRSAVPGELGRKFAVAGFALLALWLAQYVVGLVSPALQPSEWGKRPFCYLETMAYSVPPILAAVFIARRLFPLNYRRTAMLLALAAGMIPALFMQLACMYVPSHILLFHILPGLAMVLAGAALAARWRLPR